MEKKVSRKKATTAPSSSSPSSRKKKGGAVQRRESRGRKSGRGKRHGLDTVSSKSRRHGLKITVTNLRKRRLSRSDIDDRGVFQRSPCPPPTSTIIPTPLFDTFHDFDKVSVEGKEGTSSEEQKE